MKKIIFILLLSTCALSCAKAQSLGAGVSVDTQGNLKIDAPLYVIDKSTQEPSLKLAPSSMNLPVYAGIHFGQDGSSPVEFTGGIVKGRISITIGKPDEYYLNEIMDFWYIPENIFTSGADILIGELVFSAILPDYYHTIRLYPNTHVQVLTEESFGKTRFNIKGEFYNYIYSLGNVNLSVSGSVKPEWYKWAWYREINIRLNRGWNVISEGSFFDYKLNDYVETKINSIPTSEAVWVLSEEL